MRRLLLGAAAAVCLCLVVAGCSGDGDGPGFSVPAIGPADVEVDTPELRAAKADAGIEDCPEVDAPAVDGGLPELSLPCFGGGPAVELSSLRGPMVISIWGSWCPPCREEMPELQAFHEEYGDRVPLLGIAYQDIQTEGAMEFLDEAGATYPQLADPGAATDGIGDRPRIAPPTLVMIDEGGTVVFANPTVIDSPGELRDLVAEHLGVDL